MKRTITLLALVAICANVFAANVTSELPREYFPKQREPSKVDYNGFAFDLFNEMQKASEGGNVVCSPLSAQMALNMVANGAAGNTLEEMRQAMGTAGCPTQDINESNAQLMKTLTRERTMPEHSDWIHTEKDLPQIAIANGIWTRVPLYAQFVQTNQTYYEAEVHDGVDFGLQETMDAIDHWVSDKTRGTIPSIHEDPDGNIATMLINALYFKGAWTAPFEKAETSNSTFTNADGREVTVPMMHQQTYAPYAKLSACQAVRLAYFGESGELSMTLYLPDEGAQDFRLTEDVWNEVRKNASPGIVVLRVPRFEADTETNLNDMLQLMGIRDAFDMCSADFSAMSPSPLYIDKVKQLCHIAVDEDGTEASAVTVISAKETSAWGGKSLTLNRPFYFTIEDNATGTVLFAGQINELRNTADEEIGDYMPYAQGGKVWKMGQFSWDSDGAGMLEYHYLDGDTLVGGRRCHKMMRMELRPDGGQTSYMGAMYEASRLVYMALPGTEDFLLLYDFASKEGMRVDAYNLMEHWKMSFSTGATAASSTSCYKGACQAMNCAGFGPFDWMLGVGHLGFYNMPPMTTGSALRLMECRVGDEILYRDESLRDGVTPPDETEMQKNRLDFTHVVKSQPKAPRHRVAGQDVDALTGEYSAKSLYVSLLPLTGAYTVTLTDSSDNAVYTKQVQTDNVLAIDTDLSGYDNGDYTLTVENALESFTAALTLGDANGIESPLPTLPRGGDDVLYDLQGRRLDGKSLPKGIYIRHGEKVLVR